MSNADFEFFQRLSSSGWALIQSHSLLDHTVDKSWLCKVPKIWWSLIAGTFPRLREADKKYKQTRRNPFRMAHCISSPGDHGRQIVRSPVREGQVDVELSDKLNVRHQVLLCS